MSQEAVSMDRIADAIFRLAEAIQERDLDCDPHGSIADALNNIATVVDDKFPLGTINVEVKNAD